MNAKHLELALRKQRLQFEAGLQRADLARDLAGIGHALDVVDRVRDGLGWAREHAPLLSAAVLGLVIVKPRFALRLARRAWFGWLLYRRSGRSLLSLAAALSRLRRTAAARQPG